MTAKRYRNQHLRKNRHTTNDWLRYIANLDREDQRHEQRYAAKIEQYSTLMVAIMADRLYYLQSFSAPNRNCSKWQKQAQRLTGQRLVTYLNDVIRNGVHT